MSLDDKILVAHRELYNLAKKLGNQYNNCVLDGLRRISWCDCESDLSRFIKGTLSYMDLDETQRVGELDRILKLCKDIS